MFTLEIDGKAIAVINADEESARDLFTCDGFKEDIGTMTSGGQPLWNGKSDLKIRAATDEETEEFEQALAEDDGTGDFEPDQHHEAAAHTQGDDHHDEDEEEDEADIVFLVDLDDDDQDHLDA